MRKSFLVLFVVSFCSLSFTAQAQVIASLKSWKYEFVMMGKCVSFKGKRYIQHAQLLEKDVVNSYVSAARTRFSKAAKATRTFRNVTALRKWRWDENGEAGKARFVFFCSISISRAKRVKISIFAWLHDEVLNGVPIARAYIGNNTFVLKHSYQRHVVRMTYKRFFKKAAHKQFNFVFYQQNLKSRTKCTEHSDCGYKMAACDSNSNQCRKKRLSDLNSRERALLSRRRACSSSVNCFADEECSSDGVCAQKATTAKPAQKCVPSSITCSGTSEWKCRADGSSYYEHRTCPKGCDTETLRCKKEVSVAIVIPKPQPQSKPQPQPTPTTPPPSKPARQCNEAARKCSGKDVMVCREGKWTVESNCTYGCRRGLCKTKDSVLTFERVYLSVALRLGGMLSVDPELGRTSLKGGVGLHFNFHTSFGTLGVSGGWAGGGVASWHALHEALQDEWSFSLRYSNESLNGFSFTLGYARVEERIPARGIGYSQSLLHGMTLGLEWKYRFLEEDKTNSGVGIVLSGVFAPFTFREYAPGTFIKGHFTSPLFWLKCEVVFSTPLF